MIIINLLWYKKYSYPTQSYNFMLSIYVSVSNRIYFKYNCIYIQNHMKYMFCHVLKQNSYFYIKSHENNSESSRFSRNFLWNLEDICFLTTSFCLFFFWSTCIWSYGVYFIQNHSRLDTCQTIFLLCILLTALWVVSKKSAI